jgi:hypothetical protein
MNNICIEMREISLSRNKNGKKENNVVCAATTELMIAMIATCVKI